MSTLLYSILLCTYSSIHTLRFHLVRPVHWKFYSTYSYVHSLDTCNLFLNKRICLHHAKVPVSRCNKIIIVILQISMIQNSERRQNQTLRIVNSVQPDQIIWRQSGSIRPFRLNTKIFEYKQGLIWAQLTTHPFGYWDTLPSCWYTPPADGTPPWLMVHPSNDCLPLCW